MLSEKMEEALNEQLVAEFYSAYLYLSMAAYCEAEGLEGFARWLTFQAQEEQAHGMKFFDFINERGGRVELGEIEKPPTEFDSVLDVFERTLEHEKKVTAGIHELYELSQKEEDYPTQVFLEWFVEEQVEEEDSAQKIVDKLRMVEGKSHALLSLDKEMGSRQE